MWYRSGVLPSGGLRSGTGIIFCSIIHKWVPRLWEDRYWGSNWYCEQDLWGSRAQKPFCVLHLLITGNRLHSFTFVHWRRNWQPTPVSLPGESHGQRRLVGCSPWCRKESGTTRRITLTYLLTSPFQTKLSLYENNYYITWLTNPKQANLNKTRVLCHIKLLWESVQPFVSELDPTY